MLNFFFVFKKKIILYDIFFYLFRIKVDVIDNMYWYIKEELRKCYFKNVLVFRIGFIFRFYFYFLFIVYCFVFN